MHSGQTTRHATFHFYVKKFANNAKDARRAILARQLAEA
jgi:hypothetical protein